MSGRWSRPDPWEADGHIRSASFQNLGVPRCRCAPAPLPCLAKGSIPPHRCRHHGVRPATVALTGWERPSVQSFDVCPKEIPHAHCSCATRPQRSRARPPPRCATGASAAGCAARTRAVHDATKPSEPGPPATRGWPRRRRPLLRKATAAGLCRCAVFTACTSRPTRSCASYSSSTRKLVLPQRRPSTGGRRKTEGEVALPAVALQRASTRP